MTEAEIWAALERGGLARVARASDQAGPPVDARLGKYNPLLDPRGAEALAEALTDRLSESGATLIVVWEDVEDAVLGYAVGRRLGVPVLRTFNADGLVGQSGPLARGARGLLVTDCLRGPLAPRAVRALLESNGSSLLGVAALVDAGLSDGPLLASLTALPTEG